MGRVPFGCSCNNRPISFPVQVAKIRSQQWADIAKNLLVFCTEFRSTLSSYKLWKSVEPYYNYYNHFTALWTLSGTTRVSRCQKNIHPLWPLTPILAINHPLSSSSIFYDPWHPPCSIYMPDSLFHNLCPSFLLSVSWAGTLHFILHTFQSLSSFCSTCPYHRNLLCCSTEIMLSNPSLSKLNLEGTLSCSLMPHIHLPAEVPPHFLSYGPGLSSTQHTTLHTTAVQSSSHYQWCILFGKQWYQLPEFIPSNSNSGLNSCISISIFTQHVIYCKTLNFGCP